MHDFFELFQVTTGRYRQDVVGKLGSPVACHATRSFTSMSPQMAIFGVTACCRAARATALQGQPAAANISPLSSLFAALTIQTRNASILSRLRDNPGAHQKRIRVGRGPSSGKGKTSGRGHKGQGQHGKVKPWFQGGQTPLIRTWGEKGFVNQ